MSRPLKTICYRGGVVTFRIPEDWREEYDPDGGAVFGVYGVPAPNLRLNVITASGPTTTPDTPANLLQPRPGPVERLASGTALVRYVIPTEEDGTPLLITRWEIAQGIPPNHVRLVMFSWTILTAQAEDPAVQREGDLLDREIRAAVLHPEIGISGTFPSA